MLAALAAVLSALGSPQIVRETLEAPMFVRDATDPPQIVRDIHDGASLDIPAEAVDHVVTMQAVKRDGTVDPTSRTVWRSGSRHRTEAAYEKGTWTTYLDLAIPVRLSIGRDASGSLRTLDIRRASGAESAPTPKFYRRIRTGERDRLLGETCEVWRIVELEPPGHVGGLDLRTCVTTDGIVLWHRLIGSDGTAYDWQIATSLQRRPLTADEVSPPRDVLDWASWERAAPPRAVVSGNRAKSSNHEVLYRDTMRDWGATRSLRVFGSWRRETVMRTRGRSEESIGNGRLRMDYREDEDGRPLTLSLSIYDAPPAGEDDDPSGQRTPEPEEHILGETCRWSNRTPGVDHPSYECRAVDGVPLARREMSRGAINHQEATKVTRNRTTLADVTPPARIFDWAAWGVVPVR